MNTIYVVAAIIQDADRILATQRGHGDYKDGWEFPGGKIETGEKPEEALRREIREELELEIEVGTSLCTVDYDYPAFHLNMQCFWATIKAGTPVLTEHEAARWLTRTELESLAWLPADVEVVERIISNTSMQAKLKGFAKKKIGSDEIASLFDVHSDPELYRQISILESEGLIAPIMSSGPNGNRVHPIFLKYRITLREDYTGVLEEIAVLHPLLTKSEYLQRNPGEYVKHKDAIQKLNAYLFRERSTIPVSRKERSFAVFGEEKQLEDSSIKSLLLHLGLTPTVLHYYDTPEYCFNDYIPQRKPYMTLLICENKDIWFNIRRRMYEDGCREIFGTPIDGVVCGNGNKVSESGALEAYTSFLGAGEIRYLYWGDIDCAGFDIYLSALKNNVGLSINLFTEAYCEMIRLSEGRSIPDSKDGRNHRGDYREALGIFPAEMREKIQGLLNQNKRLPQEIVNYEGLLEYMR
jgi:mutator protein MutT